MTDLSYHATFERALREEPEYRPIAGTRCERCQNVIPPHTGRCERTAVNGMTYLRSYCDTCTAPLVITKDSRDCVWIPALGWRSVRP
jgi:hypothetical protein